MKPTTDKLIKQLNTLKEVCPSSHIEELYVYHQLQGRLDVLEEWKDYLVFKKSRFQIVIINKEIAKIKEAQK